MSERMKPPRLPRLRQSETQRHKGHTQFTAAGFSEEGFIQAVKVTRGEKEVINYRLQRRTRGEDEGEDEGGGRAETQRGRG